MSVDVFSGVHRPSSHHCPAMPTTCPLRSRPRPPSPPSGHRPRPSARSCSGRSCSSAWRTPSTGHPDDLAKSGPLACRGADRDDGCSRRLPSAWGPRRSRSSPTSPSCTPMSVVTPRRPTRTPNAGDPSCWASKLVRAQGEPRLRRLSRCQRVVQHAEARCPARAQGERERQCAHGKTDLPAHAVPPHHRADATHGLPAGILAPGAARRNTGGGPMRARLLDRRPSAISACGRGRRPPPAPPPRASRPRCSRSSARGPRSTLRSGGPIA